MTATGGMAALYGFLERYPKLLVLSGAGISTASGIPDYRDREGVRRGGAPIQGPEFRAFDAVRRRYWARSMVGWPTLAEALPNAGHRAIARMQAQGRIAGIVTQNVDGLHQRAGSGQVIELHGSIRTVFCLVCGSRFARAAIQSLLVRTNPGLAGAIAAPAPDADAYLGPDALGEFHIPDCPHCAGMLQPDVVFFGDGVPSWRTKEAQLKVTRSDALLVAGSSLAAYSGYRLCKLAAEAGIPIAAINLGKTRADPLFSVKVREPAEYVLPWLARHLCPF